MRSHIRTAVVVALVAALLGVFLRNVDLAHVGSDIVSADPMWLTLSVATMILNLAIRALRWRFLLEPLGEAGFANAFRATAVGFAASSVLPARAGEIVRPYFLARHEGMSMSGAFATIILERVLDLLTVLVLLALFVFFFPGDASRHNPAIFTAIKWAGTATGLASLAGLGVFFVAAGDPARLGRMTNRLERALPASWAGKIAEIVEKFAEGLGIVRRPSRLLVALAWSLPLWLSIDVGIWAVARAFGLDVPFTGSFLIVPVLTLGVAVPTPGGIGGFHEAFRLGATLFYGVPNDRAVAAALVLHAFTVGPTLLLGLFFAAQAGLNLGGMRRMAAGAQGRANI
jgi:uncharacterized protein (TIRG00374 family)